MNLPFSLSDAQKLCADFQHLLGTPFDYHHAVIQCVAVTPYDSKHKQRFLLYYHLFDHNVVAALAEYTGKLYDVMIIAKNPDGTLVNENLSIWAQKNNVAINFPNAIFNQYPTSETYKLSRPEIGLHLGLIILVLVYTSFC